MTNNLVFKFNYFDSFLPKDLNWLSWLKNNHFVDDIAMLEVIISLDLTD